MALAAAQPALRAGHRESRPALDTSLIPPISLRKGRRHAAVRRFVVIGEVIALTLVLTASASTATVAHADTAVLAVAGSIDEVLTNIRNWLMGILASLATVFLTIGGVRRVFGGGDPAEHEKSKEAFKAAGIGYALAALAPLVVTVLKGIVGA
ncbi:MAG TPA: pilin [Lentzea sp.]